MLQTGAQALQSPLDILKDLHGLGVSIADADNLTVIRKCRGSRDVDPIAYADCARITDDWLPLCAGRNSLSFVHFLASLRLCERNISSKGAKAQSI